MCADARDNLTPEGDQDTNGPNMSNGDGFAQTPSVTRQLFRDDSLGQNNDVAGRSPGTPSHLTSLNSDELVVEDVAEELNEQGDGDSTASAQEVAELNAACEAASEERLRVLVKLEDDTDDAVQDLPQNHVRFDLVDLTTSTS